MTNATARNTQHAIRNTQYAALLIILLLAFAVRVYRLDGQSLWYDEAVTAQVAAKGIAELTRWTADDIQPPLYYYAVAGWTRLAGHGEWALRFPSAFFGVLTVPLLWAVGRRLFGRGRSGQIASLAAACLAAISPLYVYYAQEARMYTLLTFWGVLAGYALLRATNDERRTTKDAGRWSLVVGRWSSFRWWLVFILAATAMLYTHYFGVFLLAAYGVILLGAWGRRTAKRPAEKGESRLKPAGTDDRNPLQRVFTSLAVGFDPRRSPRRVTLLAFLAIALLYLPWLPAMFNRYQVDRSYWQGSLKLDEALRHVAISFTAGAPETMLEVDAMRLLPWFAVAFGLAVLVLLWRGGRGAGGQGSSALVHLSTCLLVPLLAILVLASRTPKFNARYLMMVSPAYLLILAGGMGYWGLGIRDWGLPRAERTTHHALRTIQSLVPSTLFLFLVATSLVSLRNWFTDPAFTKAQWRGLIATVRAQMTPDEAVLLVSGHAWPAWDYYAPDIARTRLPEIDILDVNRVLGFEAGADLTRALAGKTGAWLVEWQDEAVDPIGIVPHFLDRAGVEQPVGREFWHLKLRHWQLRPGATYPSEPRPQHADTANYAHQVALLGWDDPQRGGITVYWRALNTITADYQVSLILEDAGGREVGRWDGRPAGYDYPTTRWRPGQALFGRYKLPLPPDALPGDYYVTLAVYYAADPAGLDIRDVADNPAGKRVRIGPVRVEG